MSAARERLIESLLERNDRRSLAALEMLRPLPLHVRVRNAAYHWSKPPAAFRSSPTAPQDTP